MPGQSAGAEILQITAFAGASFYSLGPGLGKRGWRGIFGGNGRGRRVRFTGFWPAVAPRDANSSVASRAVAVFGCGRASQRRRV